MAAETPYVREPDYALRYRDRRFATGSGPQTDARERRAIARLLARAPVPSLPGPWLDLPCGAGRLSGLLPGAGLRQNGGMPPDAGLRPGAGMLPAGVVRVDRDPRMLHACDAQYARACASAQSLPFRDRQFAGTLCMRLFQHLPGAAERIAVLKELRRVTRGPIIVSFFDALSFQHARRWVSSCLGARSGRVAMTCAKFRSELAAAGLRVAGHTALLRFVSEQRLLLALPASA